MLNATIPASPMKIVISEFIINIFNVKYNCVDDDENPDETISLR